MISGGDRRAEADGGVIGLGAASPGASCSLPAALRLSAIHQTRVMPPGRGQRGYGGSLASARLCRARKTLISQEKPRVLLDGSTPALRTGSLIPTNDLTRWYMLAGAKKGTNKLLLCTNNMMLLPHSAPTSVYLSVADLELRYLGEGINLPGCFIKRW